MMRDPDDSVIMQAIIADGEQIAREWRKDLANRIANGVGEQVAKIIKRALGK